MANYDAWSRSSYFRVKDEQAFRAAFEDYDVEIVGKAQDDSVDESGLVALLNNEDGGWPSFGEDENQDVGDVVAPHLAEGWVAVFMEAGHEKLRYVIGYAFAVNGANERRAVGLTEIYERAGELGSNVTEAEY